MKLFKFVGDHIYVRLKSMVRGSDIEACGPYHSLDEKNVKGKIKKTEESTISLNFMANTI